MESLSFLGFAAAYRRVGVVYFADNDVQFCQMSRKAALDCRYTQSFAQQMIDTFSPDVIVTECFAKARHKGQHTKQVICVLGDVAERNPILNVAVERRQSYQNKYEEATALAKRYPALAAMTPTRRLYDNEPRSTVIFEALSLIEAIRSNPTPQLARALG